MAIGIDPTVDYAFKLLLGSPEHPAITLHFLNAILGDEMQITDVEIINPILGKADDVDKLSILDVAAKDSTGRLYDIEMQNQSASWLGTASGLLHGVTVHRPNRRRRRLHAAQARHQHLRPGRNHVR